MATGSVKFFNYDKGYAFIQQEDGEGDVFVHISAIERAGLSTVREGMRVGFDVETDRKSGKPRAVNLRLL